MEKETKKPRTTMRFTPLGRELLEKLAAEDGQPMTLIIEKLLRDEARKRGMLKKGQA